MDLEGALVHALCVEFSPQRCAVVPGAVAVCAHHGGVPFVEVDAAAVADPRDAVHRPGLREVLRSLDSAVVVGAKVVGVGWSRS